MSVKIKSISVIVTRTLLGLIYFVFGLNFFLNFLPTPPSHGGAADAFAGGLFQSGYFFPMLKGLEVVFGVMLLIGAFVPLALVILMPISLNILLFHAFLAPDSVALSLIIILLHVFLAWAYRDYFKQLFLRKAAISL